jgi:hypothetical protein
MRARVAGAACVDSVFSAFCAAAPTVARREIAERDRDAVSAAAVRPRVERIALLSSCSLRLLCLLSLRTRLYTCSPQFPLGGERGVGSRCAHKKPYTYIGSISDFSSVKKVPQIDLLRECSVFAYYIIICSIDSYTFQYCCNWKLRNCSKIVDSNTTKFSSSSISPFIPLSFV